MNFVDPAVLIALLAIPLLIVWYVASSDGRTSAAAAFAAPALSASVTPRRPRWRRHVPMLAFAVALAVLIIAAARPERTVAVPVDTASIMLANDTSGSMAATDVKPTRLRPPSARPTTSSPAFPRSVRVGLIEFNTHVALLQSPTTDHAQVSSALTQLRVTGGTAIGDALQTALRTLASFPRRAASNRRGRSCCCRMAPRTSARIRSPPPSRRPRAHPDLHRRARDAGWNGHREARQPDDHGARATEPGTARGDRARVSRPGVHRAGRERARRHLRPVSALSSDTRRSSMR